MSNNKKFVVEANFIEEASKLNLSLAEFLLLMYFENSEEFVVDLDKICDKLHISNDMAILGYTNLLEKGLIISKSEKDSNGKMVDKISLDGFYDKVKETKEQKKNEQLKEDIFSTFESELNRPLSSMEFETIKAWLERYNEDLIICALKESVYNGMTNTRYIDAVLYEWHKKGLTTKEDVVNYMQNKYEKEKLEETNIFNYNWLEDNDK